MSESRFCPIYLFLDQFLRHYYINFNILLYLIGFIVCGPKPGILIEENQTFAHRR